MKTLKVLLTKIELKDIVDTLMEMISRLSIHDFNSQKLSALSIAACIIPNVNGKSKEYFMHV